MKTILITRPLHQSASLVAALRALGYNAVTLPVIEIRPLEDTSRLDAALAELAAFHWVILTSVNGVEIAWKRITDIGLHGFPEQVKVAAIGPKTAAALEQRKVRVDFVPQKYVAEAILPGLGNCSGKRFLLLRAEIAREFLPDAIRLAGGQVDDIAVYRTLPAQPDIDGLNALRQGVDWITFTSPSSVQNFVNLARQSGLQPANLPGRPVFACIGPITAAAASDENLNPLIMAEEYTAEGLVNVIAAMENLKIEG